MCVLGLREVKHKEGMEESFFVSWGLKVLGTEDMEFQDFTP